MLVFDPNGSTDEMVYFYVNIFRSGVLSVFNINIIEVIWCAMATALDVTQMEWDNDYTVCILRPGTNMGVNGETGVMDLGHCPCVSHALSKTKGDYVVVQTRVKRKRKIC